MSQQSLFPDPPVIVPEDEVVATLRAAIVGAGRLPRSADLLLSGLCAEYLVAELRNAGLSIVRSQAWVQGPDARDGQRAAWQSANAGQHRSCPAQR